MPTPFFTENFPGAAGDALPAGWLQHPAGGTILQDGANGEYGINSDFAVWYNTATPPADNYTINFTTSIKSDLSGQIILTGLLGKSATGALTGYQALVNFSDNTLYLGKVINGSNSGNTTTPLSNVGTFPGDFASSLTFNNGIITYIVGGATLVFDDTASPITGPGKICLLNYGTQTATTGAHVKNLSATVLSNPVNPPTFNPAGGTFTSAQSVTIASTTSGASIRFTTDGTNPTSTTGTVYSGAVAISATTTLKAIAYKSGMDDSTVSSATYTLNLPITTNLPNANVYAKAYRPDTNYIENNTPASKLLFGVSGSATLAAVITSPTATKWQAIVDGVKQTAVIIAANTTTATTLATGINTSGVRQIAVTELQNSAGGSFGNDGTNRWVGSPPARSCLISAILTDAGSTISASTQIPLKIMLFNMDSIGEYNAPDATCDATLCHPTFIAAAMGAYLIPRTFGGQAYLYDRSDTQNLAPPIYTPGNTAKTTIGRWDANNAMTQAQRDAVDYLVLGEGVNDALGGVDIPTLTTRVSATITQARALFANAKIFLQLPLTNQSFNSAIVAGFNAAAASNSVLITPAMDYTGSSYTFDGIHLTIAAQQSIATNDLIPQYTGSVPTVTSVSVSPATVSVNGGATQQFTATVTGTNSPAQTVTWAMVSGGGSINSTGLYTAPAATSSAQTIVVRATSTVDTSKSGTATITVPSTSPPALTGITVTLDAPATNGTRQAHAAPVPTGANLGSIVWSQTGGGSISTGGLSTPPAATTSAQTVTVTATSGSITGSTTYVVPATTPPDAPFDVQEWHFRTSPPSQYAISAEYVVVKATAQLPDGGFLSPREIALMGLEIAFSTSGSATPPADSDYHALTVNPSWAEYPYATARIRVGASATVPLAAGSYTIFIRVIATPHVVKQVGSLTIT